MSARATVLSQLAPKVGFQFQESELSSGLRNQIGTLIAEKQTYDSKRSEIGKFASSQTLYLALTVLLVTWGLILLTIYWGLLLLAGAAYTSTSYLRIRSRIRTEKTEMKEITTNMETKVSTLAPKILNELSTKRGVKADTTDATPIQVVRETILKEVVMIPCSHCRALMPVIATYCQNCGAPHRA